MERSERDETRRDEKRREEKGREGSDGVGCMYRVP
jgi:hypothetical protein